MSCPQGDDGQGYFLARMGEQLILPGLPAPQPAPAGVQYKRCNCKKAKCLKLYCVCFGAGVYCQGCNCVDCSNLPERSEVVFQERQRVLQREPMAFTSKVVGPAHFKGCKCRKSRCVKKYCDCYDAKVRCSDICKCKDCQNKQDHFGSGPPSFAFSQPPQQHPSLLLALQQQQQQQLVGTDHMDIDLPTLARVQLPQQEGVVAELQVHPGSLPSSLPGSQPGSRPGSQPSSRAASPTGHMVVLRPGALPQFAAVPAVAKRPSAGTSGSSGGAAALNISGSSGGQQPLHRVQSLGAATAAAGAAASSTWGPQQGEWGQQLVAPSAEHSLDAQARAQQQHQQRQQGAWQQLQPAAAPGDFAALGGAQQAAAAALASQQQAAVAAAALVAQIHAQGTARVSSSCGMRGDCEQPLMCTEQAVVDEEQERQGQQQLQHQRSSSRERSTPAEAQCGLQARPAAGPVAQQTNGQAETAPPPASPKAGAGPAQAASEAKEAEAAAVADGSSGGLAPKGLLANHSTTADKGPADPAAAAAGSGDGTAAHPSTSTGLLLDACDASKAGQQQQQHEQQHLEQSEPAAKQADLHQQQHTGVQKVAIAANTAEQEHQKRRHEAAMTVAEDDMMDADEQEQRQEQCQYAAEAGQQANEQQQQQQVAASMGMLSAMCRPTDGFAGATAAGTAVPGQGAADSNADIKQQACNKLSIVCPNGMPAASTSGSRTVAADRAAAAGSAVAGTAHVPASQHQVMQQLLGRGAAAVLDPYVILEDPGSAGQLAQSLGLDPLTQVAATNAAQFLRDIISLSRLDSAVMAATGGTGMAGISQAMQQQHKQQQQLLLLQEPQADQLGLQQEIPAGQRDPGAARIMHPSAAVGSAGGVHVAVLTDQPLAAIVQPVASAAVPAAAGVAGAGAGKLSPAVHSLHMQRQLSATSTPQAVPGAAAAGAFGASGAVASIARSLSSMGGAAATPSPVTGGHAFRLCGSVRGPSPLGPVGARGREAVGLHALLGPGKQYLHHQHQQQQQQQQQQHGTPVAAPPSISAAAPGSGTSSAAGGGGSNARRSMQLLPGSFRLTGSIQSPAVSVSHGSPATAGPIASTGGHGPSHLAPSVAAAAGHTFDSPAGSISFAPSAASGGPPSEHAAAAGHQQQTPVFCNSDKAQQLQERQQQEQPQLDQQDMAASAAAGAQTPISELMAAAAVAAAAAPTPTFWQQQQAQNTQQQHGLGRQQSGEQVSDEGDRALLGTLFSGGHVGGSGPALHDMTPSSLFIASLLAARTPTDIFLTSPLPPIGSALRGAAATGGPTSGVRAGKCGATGTLLGDVTPLLLNIGGSLQQQQQHGAAGSGSSGARCSSRGRGSGGAWQRGGNVGRQKNGVGVSALCTGWGSAGMVAAPTAIAPARAGGAGADGRAASETAGAAGAAAGGSGSQHDAPASGMKPDTDKAAARAAAAATAEGGGTADVGAPAAGDACDAGVSSLLAAANYISTPEDDEGPTKRRRQDPGREHTPEAGSLPGFKQSSRVVDVCAASWAAVKEQLDTKHAADAAAGCDKLANGAAVAALTDDDVAAAATGAAAASAQNQPRRVLLAVNNKAQTAKLQDAAAKHQPHQPHQQQQQQQQQFQLLPPGQQVWGSQASTVRQLSGSTLLPCDWGSQPGLAGSRSSQGTSSQEQQQGVLSGTGQDLQRCSSADDKMQQQQQQQQQQQFPNWQDKQRHNVQPMQQDMGLENTMPMAGAPVVHKQQAGAVADMHMPGCHQAAPWQQQQQPGSPAASHKEMQRAPAATAQRSAAAAVAHASAPYGPAAAAGHQHDDLQLQSPPVPAKPSEFAVAHAASDRSPSIESFAAADAMLALCDPSHFRQR